MQQITQKVNQLKPYPKYKDSENEWLGEIPDEWRVKKLRHILKPVTKKNRADLPLLSVVRDKGVIKRDVSSKDENHNVIPEDLSNYKVVNVGQFAMNKMKAWQGSYGISDYEGIVSPAYFIFNLDGVVPKFFHIAARSKSYIPFFTQASDGVRIGQWDLSLTRMKEIPLAIPSEDEQSNIVRYLNYTNSRIAKFIAAKKKLINLLEEQKQAIIHQAVTGAIDVRTGKPYPKYKESGVEWLGKVPEDWETNKLRVLLKLNIKRNRADLPLLSVTREKGVILRDIEDLESNHNFIPDDLSNYKVVHKGQFAMNKMKAWQGSYGISRFDGIISPAYFIFDLMGVSGEFFHHAIRSKKSYVPFFTQASDGVRTGQWDLSISRMKEIQFFIPSVEEQNSIVNFINSELIKINRTIDQTNEEMDLLKEYRTRLTADVVTGKVDVREVAKNLPDSIEPIVDEVEGNDTEEVSSEDFDVSDTDES